MAEVVIRGVYETVLLVLAMWSIQAHLMAASPIQRIRKALIHIIFYTSKTATFYPQSIDRPKCMGNLPVLLCLPQ